MSMRLAAVVVLSLAAPAVAQLKVPAMADDPRKIFWLGAHATNVCYTLPPGFDPTKRKRLELVVPMGGGLDGTLTSVALSPPLDMACVPFSAPASASVLATPAATSRFRITEIDTRKVLVETPGFSVGSVALSLERPAKKYKGNKKGLALKVRTTFNLKDFNGIADRIQIVGADNQPRDCYLANGGSSKPDTDALVPQKDSVVCSFTVPKKKLQSPIRILFYANTDPIPVTVLTQDDDDDDLYWDSD